MNEKIAETRDFFADITYVQTVRWLFVVDQTFPVKNQGIYSKVMAKSLPNFHGSKVYNLTSGATLPSWISDRKKRELSKVVLMIRPFTRLKKPVFQYFPTILMGSRTQSSGGGLSSFRT